ncbi:unnamed protein product [Phyllotreta striolata]|uniref:Tyrosine specific protein phosphatases domain-containing protein n=1 Tax=Phyllotreta striolata TaxID=444603 RepID=A0A9N9XQV5_PHYSR|nr:unnamed protein product [Phyllotreta striolata]
MGNNKNNKIPKGWLGCPDNGSSLIARRFMPLKTPLNDKYLNKVPPGNEYPPSEIFERAENNRVNIGLWIDLTNTDRYYDKSEIESRGCQYVKLSCHGHGTCPSVGTTKKFIAIVNDFVANNPQDCIAVHCTHGFNRTGFLIVAYLVQELRFDVQEAVEDFAEKRYPGIYRANYIRELFKRYGPHIRMIPNAPPQPEWARK